MLENKNEFLFNVLMANEIPFIRIGGKKEFILLDQKVRISTFEAEPILKMRMQELNYKDYILKDEMIEPKLLSKILNIDWVARYKSIRL